MIALRPNFLTDKYREEFYVHKNKDVIFKFIEESGLKLFLLNNKDIDLYSYLIGIELGLDTHCRKNRNGAEMEKLCEHNIVSTAKKYNFKLRRNYNLKEIGINKNVDFFLIKNNIKIAIEVNKFNKQGSKMKSISEEYYRLNSIMKQHGVIFVWVTGGNAWFNNKKLLERNINNIDNFINLKMLENKALDNIIKNYEQQIK